MGWGLAGSESRRKNLSKDLGVRKYRDHLKY